SSEEPRELLRAYGPLDPDRAEERPLQRRAQPVPQRIRRNLPGRRAQAVGADLEHERHPGVSSPREQRVLERRAGFLRAAIRLLVREARLGENREKPDELDVLGPASDGPGLDSTGGRQGLQTSWERKASTGRPPGPEGVAREPRA